ncbi:MAG: PorV/PorQ family protein [Candidatus Kryptonium sp.]
MRKIKYLKLKLIFIAVFALSIQNSATAQTNTGTTIGQFLLIEPSARLAGMGNVGAAMFDEISALYFNPASSGLLQNSGVIFSHANWLAGISYDYSIIAIKTKNIGTFFLSITYLNSGEIDVRTVEKPLGTGEKYRVTNFALGIGYGFKITDKFSTGLQINYIQETIWHSSLWAVALNIGIIYELGNNLFLGTSISNFGTRGKYEGWDLRVRYDPDPRKYGDNSNLPAELFTEKFSLPLLFRIGLSYQLNVSSSIGTKFSIEAHHPSDNTESLSFGGEIKFFDVFSARAGYQKLFQKDSEVGLTAGAGLQYPIAKYVFKLDYAWADHGRLGSTQKFSIGIEF